MRIIVCFFLLLLANPRAFGCFCALGIIPKCQQMRSYKGTALFLGTVTGIRYEDVTLGKDSVRQQVATFQVDDAFRGIHAKSVMVTSFVEPGMCGYRFRKGSKYLVDAWGPQDALSVDSCGMTVPAVEAADSIRLLRTLRQHPDGAIIFGTVKQYVPGSNFVSLSNKAIPTTTVLLEFPPDGLLQRENRKVAADPTGWYEFVGLPAGVYDVTTQLPSGFSGVLKHTIEIQADGCAQVDVRAHARGD